MRTLIVDDEPIARRVLAEELEAFPNVELSGEAANGKQALLKIAELKPDLVFLDLQMPVMSGFEVIQNLQDAPPPVMVIVTAFDQHAIRAFEAGAIDYLLKPVNGARLQKAVERAQALQRRPVDAARELERVAMSVAAIAPAPNRKIVGRTGEEYHLLDADDVLAFQAERELVWIITAKQRLLATQSLQAIEGRLAGSQFRRVHRNAIVNVNHVRKMSALSSQRWLVTLSNSLQLIVSKRLAHSIRDILHW
ncbi:MAG TPA: LytTR family DNA-binding domain-containing protein [Bryobacteraceae bacterium]|jgi:DNA-binding LytR/AlgR family response regulator|nr:LytTR family DNA-binding domain-containing protein [Bryobacteraceae bacterium]